MGHGGSWQRSRSAPRDYNGLDQRTAHQATIEYKRDTVLRIPFLFLGLISISVLSPAYGAKQASLPEPVVLSAGWELQDVAKVAQPGAEVASEQFKAKQWYPATVPGTVLTTLVNNHVYPEPLYGENNRPDIIPESLCRTSYWYRTEVKIPKEYAGKHIWLNFDGINYSSRSG